MRASIEQIQERLQQLKIDGWLFHVWRNVNPVAITTLGLDEEDMRTRRCYYFVPAEGEPRKLQHAIEPHSLSHLPGQSMQYLSYQSLRRQIGAILGSTKTIAMEYSHNCLIPTVSWVDAGTIELVRSTGVEIVSSAELIQYFEATLDDEQISSHFRASEHCRKIAHDAFAEIGRRIRDGKAPTEYEIQKYIMNRFEAEDLIWDGDPIVAANAHASDPHYSPDPEHSSTLKEGDLILIDLWSKETQAGAVYADQTWMGYIGDTPPADRIEIWELVRDARRAGMKLIEDRIATGDSVHGWEVDDAVRKVIVDAGHGEAFIHRTGHSITTLDHGSGANIDNLETKDLRPLIPRTCFSIEPGVYLPEFGVRSENNVMIMPDGGMKIAEGCDQKDLILVNL
jgi:Xaa-Pro aminopeptidase